MYVCMYVYTKHTDRHSVQWLGWLNWMLFNKQEALSHTASLAFFKGLKKLMKKILTRSKQQQQDAQCV
jgi:hypothetical protein